MVCPKLSERIPARVVLGVMAFLMFLVTQMIRSNLYIAIVAMVPTVNSTSHKTLETNTLDWNDRDKSLIMGAFYWSYWVTELPGGLLAQRYGGRRVLGLSVLAAGLLNLVLPMACRTHYWLAALARALQGLSLGVTWPAMHSLSAHWIPSTERSKFMTSYHGAAVGTALTYPLSGVLIATLGWDYVFYVTGCLTLAWCAVWWYVVYDRPSDHPRLSHVEQKYLQRCIEKLNTPKTNEAFKTPWISILRSGPFWAVLVASQGLMWGSITLSMQLPAYFNDVYQLDIKTNGFVSGLPELCKFAFGLLFSCLIDFLLRSKILSLTNARKISVATCEYIPCGLMILLAYLNTNNTTVAVALLATSSAVGGASSSGSLANIVDISPNFAGTILGLIKTLTFIPGVLSPFVVTQLTSKDQLVGGWNTVFYLLAIIYAVCGTVFLIFGSGEVQPWNKDCKTSKTTELEELVVTQLPPDSDRNDGQNPQSTT